MDVNQSVTFMISDRRSHDRQTSSETRRQCHRYPVAIVGELTNSRLGDRSVEISDLSHQGCRLWLRATLPVGHLVMITFPTLAPLLARVIWSDGQSSGLNFSKPLGVSVLQMMAERHKRAGIIAI